MKSVATPTLLDVLLRESQLVVIIMWSGSYVKTMGVLAVRSGESELAAVVRAATEGFGLQSMFSDFDFCSHVMEWSIESD